MTLFASVALRNGLLQGTSVKELLDNGFLYIFAGTVPVDADAALDMTVGTGVHTQLVKVAADAVPVDSGVTGLLFAASASNGALAKDGAQTWAGVINFVGKDQAQAGVSPLTATFFRFCSASDNGQGIGGGATPRIQGTIGTSGTDLVVTSVSLADNGSNTFGINTCEVRQPSS